MKKLSITSKLFFILVVVASLFAICLLACSCSRDVKKDGGPVTYTVLDNTKNLNSFGSLDAECTPEEFLKHFSYGDLVSVKIDGSNEEFTMPVCGSYDDVSPGELCIRAKEGENTITIAIAYGQFAARFGFAKSNPSGSATKYSAIEGKLPAKATIIMKEEGAYKDRIEVGKLNDSNDRNAYSNLSDEQFANFREIKCGSIKPGVFYRASSPIDPQLGRNTYADQACANHKIVSALNLQDSLADAKNYSGYANSYYSTMKVQYQKMSLSLGTSDFNNNVASCLRFFINNDGPYVCHCVYGKDRTGFVCAVVEALCGASMDEICEDYTATYNNFYNVDNGKQQPINDYLKNTINNIIIENMSYAFGAEVNAKNINQKTEEYVKSIGLTQNEIDTIRHKLK